MQVNGKYNKISPELKAKIPALKNGEVVTFQFLTGIKNPDPDPTEQVKRPILFGKQQIPMRDRIYDKYAKNDAGEVVGEWVDIVVADGWDKGEPTREHFFFPALGENSIWNGKFSLMGGKGKDEEIYEHLMLTNLNEAPVTGQRDTTRPALIKIINTKSENSTTLRKLDVLREAMNLSAEIAEDEARLIGQSLNWNEYADVNELLVKVQDFARMKPDEFLALYKDKSKEFKIQIKKALTLGVISMDMLSGKVSLGTEVITTLAAKDKGDIVSALGKWFETADNGNAVFEEVKKQIASKQLAPA